MSHPQADRAGTERRFAVYFAPAPETELWRFGSGLIGYDAATGHDLPTPPGLPVEPSLWRRWTDAPARYGFHATLKAPFEPRADVAPDEILDVARRAAGTLRTISLPALDVALVGAFVALVPSARCPALDRLAEACVTAFEPVRAALGESDRARRREAALTPRQAAYLDRYGYPYVFEEFRFHMTLTGPLPPERRDEVRSMLADRYARIAPGAAIDALTVFGQETRADRFRVLARVPLPA